MPDDLIFNHLYRGTLMETKERNGTMRGIVCGDHNIDPQDL